MRFKGTTFLNFFWRVAWNLGLYELIKLKEFSEIKEKIAAKDLDQGCPYCNSRANCNLQSRPY